jgi:hypothetical protein
VQKPLVHRLLGPLGLLCLGAALVGPGCHGDQPGQIEHIQLFSRALRTKVPRAACGALIQKLQDEINCDSVLVPLLHYAPGFPGSNITRRGHASGWRFSSIMTVPIRYEGTGGSGNADVTMQRLNGQWRISLFTPVP